MFCWLTVDVIPDLSSLDDLSKMLDTHKKSFQENRENVKENQLLVGEVCFCSSSSAMTFCFRFPLIFWHSMKQINE
jgi:hypothetical protein